MTWQPCSRAASPYIGSSEMLEITLAGRFKPSRWSCNRSWRVRVRTFQMFLLLGCFWCVHSSFLCNSILLFFCGLLARRSLEGPSRCSQIGPIWPWYVHLFKVSQFFITVQLEFRSFHELFCIVQSWDLFSKRTESVEDRHISHLIYCFWFDLLIYCCHLHSAVDRLFFFLNVSTTQISWTRDLRTLVRLTYWILNET